MTNDQAVFELASCLSRTPRLATVLCQPVEAILVPTSKAQEAMFIALAVLVRQDTFSLADVKAIVESMVECASAVHQLQSFPIVEALISLQDTSEDCVRAVRVTVDRSVFQERLLPAKLDFRERCPTPGILCGWYIAAEAVAKLPE